MPDYLDIPALGDFLCAFPPSVVMHDSTAPGRQGGSHQLDATQWLERLADVLGCSPLWLLDTGRVTIDDLDERGHIGRAARLIRSYGWEAPPVPIVDRVKHSSTDGQPLHGHPCAAIGSPVWRPARDHYHRHLFGCRACFAPTGRHCPTGAALRAVYDSIAMESSA